MECRRQLDNKIVRHVWHERNPRRFGTAGANEKHRTPEADVLPARRKPHG